MKKAKSILSLLLALFVVMGCTSAALAAVVEVEENGTIATATSFSISEVAGGTISGTTDVDYFSFTVVKPGLAVVSLSHTALSSATASYFKVTIMDVNENPIIAFTSKGSDAKVESEGFSVAPATTYYIKVEGDTVVDSTLNYNLGVVLNEAALTEAEPNDTADKATPLTLSSKGNAKYYSGTISKENDVDYYSFNIPSPGIAYFYLYNGAGALKSFTASLITYVEEAGGTSVEKSLGDITVNVGEATKISPSLGLNGGKYLLKVSGLNGATGGYQTRVFFGAASDVEYEYNDVITNANLIQVGKSMTASTFNAADKDIFRFAVPANNSGYDITVGAYEPAQQATAQWKVTVKDQSNKIVAQDIVATNKTAAVISTDKLAAGTYYIEVTAGELFSSEIYKVSIAAKSASTDPDDGDKSFWDKVKELDWAGFIDNFRGWFLEIDVAGIVKSIGASIMSVITFLISMGG